MSLSITEEDGGKRSTAKGLVCLLLYLPHPWARKYIGGCSVLPKQKRDLWQQLGPPHVRSTVPQAVESNCGSSPCTWSRMCSHCMLHCGLATVLKSIDKPRGGFRCIEALGQSCAPRCLLSTSLWHTKPQRPVLWVQGLVRSHRSFDANGSGTYHYSGFQSQRTDSLTSKGGKL